MECVGSFEARPRGNGRGSAEVHQFSCYGGEATTTTATTNTTEKSRQRRRLEQRTGNPAYLSTLQWAVKERNRMYDLYTPVEEHSEAPYDSRVAYPVPPGLAEMARLLTKALNNLTPADRTEALTTFHRMKADQRRFLELLHPDPGLSAPEEQPSSE